MSQRKRKLPTEVAAMPWPHLPLPVFEGNHRHPFVANRSWGMSVTAFCDAYRFAAEALFDRHVEKRVTNNYLIFPLAFLWRHYLELSLKALHTLLPDVGGYSPRGDFEDGHNLVALWTPLAEHFRGRGFNKNEIRNVDAVIRLLHEVDPGGDGFRYPVGTKKTGRPKNLTRVPATVDLVQFDLTMRSVGNYLDGTVSMFMAEWDAVPRDEG